MNLINFLLTDIGMTIVWIEVALMLWLMVRYFFYKDDNRDLTVLLCIIWPLTMIGVIFIVTLLALNWIMELRLDFWRKK